MNLNGTELMLCDRDGTLFGTCAANVASYAAALRELNHVMPEAMELMIHQGESWIEISKVIFPKFSVKEISYIAELKKKEFAQRLNLCNFNADLHKDYLAHKLWGLVTNGTLESSVILLNYFGIKLGKERIFTPSKDIQPKPFPDLYFEAIRFFKLDKSVITVFEDSITGFKSAHSAGLLVNKIEHQC